MTPRELVDLGKKSVYAWMDDYAPSMGAALAYYTLFSLAPVLVIVSATAGLVFGVETARTQIVGELQALIGEEGAAAVQSLLKGVSQPSTTLLASIVSIGTLIVAATSVFNELQSDLDRIWRAPALEKKTGLWSLLRARLLTFGMVLAVGFLLLVSLVIDAGLSALGKWWGPYFGAWEITLHAVNLVVSFALVTALFALIYKILPRVRVDWHDVWTGAAVTSALFTFGKFAIGLYLGKSRVTSGFGAAGSIAVLLVWVYYSAQIFLLGAEFTWVFSHRHGSRAAMLQTPAPAVPTKSNEAQVEPELARGGRLVAFTPVRKEEARSRWPKKHSIVPAWLAGFALGAIWRRVGGRSS